MIDQAQQEIEAQKPQKKEPLEPDEEVRQQEQLMMRKYYRNRHATFMKALLDKKKNEQQNLEDQKAKEERKKKKVRDKVLAGLTNEVVQTDTKPDIVPIKRSNNSVIGRTVRSSSLSVQNTDTKKFIKGPPANGESTTISSQIPSSKEDKKRLMKEVYGFNDDQIPRRKLNRASSRGSVRSTQSVETPIASRKDRFASGRRQPGQA